MGFKGCYRATDDSAAVEEYKRKLTNFIGEGVPQSHSFFDIKPAAVEDRETSRNRMRSLKPWFRMGAAVLVIYLIVSSAVWLTSIRVLNRIMLGME